MYNKNFFIVLSLFFINSLNSAARITTASELEITVDELRSKYVAIHKKFISENFDTSNALNSVKKIILMTPSRSFMAQLLLEHYIQNSGVAIEFNVIRYLIDKGANLKKIFDSDKSGYYLRNSILYRSADLNSVKLFVSLANDLDLLNSENESLIYSAISREKIFAVKALLEAGADINKPNNKGITPYGLAMIKNDLVPEIKDLVLQEPARRKINIKRKEEIIFKLIKYFPEELVRIVSEYDDPIL